MRKNLGRKIIAVALAAATTLTMGSAAFAQDAGTTDVGTPRAETLIMETQTPTDLPGIFNPYMIGVQQGFGIHQLITAHMWEIDTALGEQFGEVAADMPEPNEDFTEFTVKIREGMKWSDGERRCLHHQHDQRKRRHQPVRILQQRY